FSCSSTTSRTTTSTSSVSPARSGSSIRRNSPRGSSRRRGPRSSADRGSIAMTKIWGRANSINVQKVLWCADELGLAYERVDVGGAFGGNDKPEYLAKNPNGLVPVLEEADGFVLWESNTIVRYLAARHGSGTL